MNNVTFTSPRYLLDQIQRRADVKGHSRNTEMRYLMEVALEHCDEADAQISVGGNNPVRSVVSIDDDFKAIVVGRAQRFSRSISREIVRLMAFALEESAKRDLALISQMLEQGPLARGS